MRTVKIKFVGFWSHLQPEEMHIYNILKKHYNVEICDDPDYIICSMFGDLYDYCFYDGIRIFYSGENYTPDFNLVDYAIGYDNLKYHDRFLQFPEALKYRHYLKQAEDKHKDIDDNFLGNKTHFANFIFSHESEHGEREKIFELLSKYKKVDSVGTFLNNSEDGYVTDNYDKKLDFLNKCKFTIAFESTELEDFYTEKIIHAYGSKTVPIYFGNKNINDIFNPKSFINCMDFPSLEAAAEYIAKVDQDDALYMEMIKTPAFNDPDYVDKKYKELEDFILHIFEQDYEKAFRRPRHSAPEWCNDAIKSWITDARYEHRNSRKFLFRLLRKIESIFYKK